VNTLLAEGRHHEALGENLTEEAFRRWLEQVLQALDGIPAEIGAPSLVRSAATAAKSQMSSLSKKMINLNKLLGRAIKAVS
jgi:truncated hemoglobin YjbI